LEFNGDPGKGLRSRRKNISGKMAMPVQDKKIVFKPKEKYG
jgi:hypothetical protein